MCGGHHRADKVRPNFIIHCITLTHTHIPINIYRDIVAKRYAYPMNSWLIVVKTLEKEERKREKWKK